MINELVPLPVGITQPIDTYPLGVVGLQRERET